MMGYLHIPTDRFEAAASVWIAETFGFSRDVCESAGSDLVAFLRGLSVEPTEDDRSPARCRAYAAVLMGVVLELDDRESAELVTARAMQWEAEAEPLVAASVPVREDRPACEHGRTGAHRYPNPHCVEQWPEEWWCPGPAAESEGSALVVQEDRP